MLTLGSRRVAIRLFKSWHQYNAESLGMNLNEYYEAREKTKDGPYEEWKRQVATSTKIDFLLDHSSPEEQSTYLKEFDTLELAKYLMQNVDNLPEHQLKQIVEMPVPAIDLPIFREFFGLGLVRNKAPIKKDTDQTETSELRELAFNMIKRKIKEVELRRLDADISKVHTEVQATLP